MTKKKNAELDAAANDTPALQTSETEKKENEGMRKTPPDAETTATGETFREKSIYIGPTIAKFGLTENAIYKTGAPYPIDAVKKIPALKKLIIPIKDFAPALPRNLKRYYNRAAMSAGEL